ncbi:MAG: hypothetical protein KatS3mg082_0902 [Nitrospiraceae bacterium]|nr:MAG: hypothetical protein KatS3mg082_0902 [Nitrospiraceae bacterium]
MIGVMGPGKASRAQLRSAMALGEEIARNGWVLLTGGRAAGVMDAVNRGAKRVPGSLTIGVLPTAGTRVSRFVDVAIVTDMGNARNNVNVLSSDVVVACGPGGPGMIAEVALALKARKPVILLGGDPLEEKMFTKLGGKLVRSARTPQAVVEMIRRHLNRRKA